MTLEAAQWQPSGRGSAIEPLDAAVELIRARYAQLLPIYIVAVTPLAAGVWLAIDAVTAQDRAALPAVSGILVAALLWRWVWLAVLQRHVQTEVRGEAPAALRRRLAPILVARLIGALSVTWGALLLVLPLFGLLFGALATPAVLEREHRATAELMRLWRWIATAAGRLVRLTLAMGVGVLVVLLGGAAVQFFVAQLVLPSIFGLDTTDLLLTMQSVAWWWAYLFVVFALFDLYWNVAAVLVFYDVQAKRLGSDLRRRLVALREQPA